MTLRTETKMLRDAHGALRGTLEHNAKLLDIHEGNLLPYIDDDLRRQLSPQSYAACRDRIAPINLLVKIVEKMSTIYQPGPARRLVAGSEADKALFAWYLERMAPNVALAAACELFNLNKGLLLQPYVHQGQPRLRAVQNDHFFVVSRDPVDPLTPTHVVTFEGCGDGEVDYQAYTAGEFLAFNSKDEVDGALMAQLNNAEGVNPFQALPFVYASASKSRLMAKPDTDVLAMTKLIPLLFTDLNYAVMYQSFSIIYGIDIDDENLARSPSAFWRFKTSGDGEKKPEIGQIKPDVDIDPVLTLIQTQLALWLNTRGIRPGAVGKLDKDNFASGISKMVDEMDTYEARQKLVERFTAIETALWDLVMHKMHPVWAQQGLIDNGATFSSDAKAEVVFPTQTAMAPRGQLVADVKAEEDAGYITRKLALKRLNPMLSEEEVDALLKEIDEERAARAADAPKGADDKQPEDDGKAKEDAA